jgi:hypothetical protein
VDEPNVPFPIQNILSDILKQVDNPFHPGEVSMIRKSCISLFILCSLVACAPAPAVETTLAPTATPEPTPTPQPALPAPVENEDGTLTITTPFSATLTRAAGPYDGKLIGQSEYVPNDCAGVELENFMLDVTFTNPNGVGRDSWDYGIFFRGREENEQLRLIFYYYAWYLSRGIEEAYASGGAIYDMSDGDTNHVQLFVLDDEAYLYVNGYQQGKMDVSSYRGAGDVCVAGWTYTGDPLYVTIGYSDFSVWTIE